MKVGLVGVGTMGSRIAEALINAGFEVIARDISPEAERRAREMGAKVVNSPKEVAQSVNLSLLSLPLPSDVEEVVCREDGLLAGTKPGDIIVDLSTVDPSTTQRNAALAKEKGVGYLDAPVLGRPQTCGKWTLPIGGDKESLEKARDVLSTIAKQLLYVGPPGSGNIVKLLNNMMLGVINAVSMEIIALAAKVGMSPKVLYDTIASSGAASVSNLFTELVPKVLDRNFEPRFSIDLLYKDLSLAIGMARESGAPLFMTPFAQLLNEMARAKGLGAEDTGAVVKIYEEYMNVLVKASGRTDP